jgi:hypothetical protein
MQKWIYLLEHHSAKQPVNVGVFTSLTRAKRFVKTLSRSMTYAIYRLPTNKCLTEGRKLKDVQGFFDHWHYGTVTKAKGRNKAFVVWPE